ncbi:MAG: transcription termination factor NusA [Phycisphaeraceae bacterium]|nr:transcription termination factor NusA [Phycisphaeraceae bacterium]
MNSQEMIRLIDTISRDRNVDPELLFNDLEQALVSAARKHFNALDTEDFSAEIDRQSGEIRIWRGEDQVPLEELGRIPAQTAKQVMIQRFREDERDSIYAEFMHRVGELVTGMAQRYEGGSLIVQVDRAEAFMPRSEQIRGEQHQPGERVRCMILDVRDTGSQVKIVVSRSSPELIRRLFEVEVPEVAERVIEIRAMAREAGHRTKIAVASIDSRVDAVGACVGVRGSRIKNIVDELGGEKIDIVRWNESSQILIENALKPADVREISLCFELGRATVVVDEDQLSLAIGKRGQNVRLAARLTGWDIDIMTPEEFTRALDILDETLREVDDITEEHVDRLAALGIISVFDVEDVGLDYLVDSLECTPEQAEKIGELAAARAKVVAEQQQKEKEEAERRRAEEQAAGDSAIVNMLEKRQEEGDEEGEGDGEADEEGIIAPGPAAEETDDEAAEAAVEEAGEASAESDVPRDEALAEDAVETPAPEEAPDGSDSAEVLSAEAAQEGSAAEAVADETAPEDGTPDLPGDETEAADQAEIEPETDEGQTEETDEVTKQAEATERAES